MFLYKYTLASTIESIHDLGRSHPTVRRPWPARVPHQQSIGKVLSIFYLNLAPKFSKAYPVCIFHYLNH